MGLMKGSLTTRQLLGEKETWIQYLALHTEINSKQIKDLK